LEQPKPLYLRDSECIFLEFDRLLRIAAPKVTVALRTPN